MERNYKRLTLVQARKFTSGIICSIALMLIMLAVFSSAAAGLSRTAAMFSAESRAVLVMDHTLERIGFRSSVDAAEIEKIFKEEFAAAGLKSVAKASCMVHNSKLTLRIMLQREEEQRLLAEVTVSCLKK